MARKTATERLLAYIQPSDPRDVLELAFAIAKEERDAIRWEIANGPFVTRTGDARKGGVSYVEVMHVLDARDAADETREWFVDVSRWPHVAIK